MSSFTESLQIISLFLWPSRNRTVSVYELLGQHNSLGEQAHYINLGYWKNTDSFDQACENMALLLAEKAQIQTHEKILDVGCGFGQQDQFWMQKFKPKHITAINITPLHIDTAKKKFAAPNIDFKLASATDLPFESNSFDTVLGLESAFHFDTREDFFKEAYRVLKPGGQLVLADVIPSKTPYSWLDKLRLWFLGGLWQVPGANNYDLNDYLKKLTQHGFEACQSEDISEHVWKPFKTYAQKKVQEPEVVQRVHPFLRKIWGTPHAGTQNFLYIIIQSKKPSFK